MNYIFENNQFDIWRETNQLSFAEVLLWFILMQINNKCGWKSEFSVALSVLQTKTGLSKSSIVRARDGLQKAKRISFKSRTGQQSAVYHIIAFHTETQSDTQNIIAFPIEPESESQNGIAFHTETQSDTINKLNNSKLNSNYTQAQVELFKGYQNWILINAPNVAKMKYPFTIDQYFDLQSRFGNEQINSLILDMGNHKPLLTKYNSAYRTFCNWSKVGFRNADIKQNNSGPSPSELKAHGILNKPKSTNGIHKS
jgi:hypothetical protein